MIWPLHSDPCATLVAFHSPAPSWWALTCFFIDQETLPYNTYLFGTLSGFMSSHSFAQILLSSRPRLTLCTSYTRMAQHSSVWTGLNIGRWSRTGLRDGPTALLSPAQGCHASKTQDWECVSLHQALSAGICWLELDGSKQPTQDEEHEGCVSTDVVRQRERML